MGWHKKIVRGKNIYLKALGVPSQIMSGGGNSKISKTPSPFLYKEAM